MSAPPADDHLAGVAFVICDVWDSNWCRTAVAGTDALAHRLAAIVPSMRGAGAQVVHAPSDTVAFYADTPARRWVADLPAATAPAEQELDWPLPPLNRPWCPDQPPCTEPHSPPWPWTRQHEAIEILPTDAILDSGTELLAVMRTRNLDRVVIAGVHTNMCVLHRSFGIKQLVRWGVPCVLVGDLTEAMPADYTDAVLDYVRAHWCPVRDSAQLLAGRAS